jgi:hypothetical protein
MNTGASQLGPSNSEQNEHLSLVLSTIFRASIWTELHEKKNRVRTSQTFSLVHFNSTAGRVWTPVLQKCYASTLVQIHCKGSLR